ncbi:YbaK/EbsC family protein [Thermoflexus sp.]|uniref:YbaK/EbsC family protein n=1 Tax=Thermoflexus sp. TaxID=1969742 RepID=UPI0025F4ABF6|nr:YbaK/EbsC family protein [Thermoflexus sp.]MDW8179680.1 YbaK/EbsC family protein [Anaerolineae bacterium]MCS6963944.1 YbaK/EbsC family protein [Thermoflexus sp.]MCS7350229.1 YbaK/EbsC family protein [Thermoflexus sp.]MCX7691500.1 YbaK/EbsC family protein [Thermoflexus sp.]MDW8184341.1 YbaK/EbsC family protein [Anaerolineae bacterium]
MSARGPQDVQAFLDRYLPGTSVRILDQSTATAVEAAAAVGCPLGAIVKSLLFVADEDPRLVLVAGDRKADQRLLAALWGIPRKRIRIADPETVLRVTGYEVGGVPPVAHATPLEIWMDASLARYETLWAAAGARNALFPISFADLARITGGQVAEFTVEAAPGEPSGEAR